MAYGLTDSPVGQLAWIAEKFKEWTDCRNRPEDAVHRDQMLTNVMLYWLTGTAGCSARRELMSRMGHSTARAALIYQHAGADRERLIADSLSDLLTTARKTADGTRKQDHGSKIKAARGTQGARRAETAPHNDSEPGRGIRL